jgi:hypothetical protein
MNMIAIAPSLDATRRPMGTEPLCDSIFEQHWWFDAAVPGNWDVCEVHRDNVVVGSLAYTSFRKLGFRHIQMPSMTRTLQPRIIAPGTKAVSRLQNQVSILTELVGRLPDFDRFEICLPPESELALPFTLAGFSNTATFTYRCVAEKGSDPWLAMEQKTRNTVATAKKRFRSSSITTSTGILLYRAHRFHTRTRTTVRTIRL